MWEIQITIEQIIKILIALVLGGIIGFEREWADKSAGIRTHLLVSLAACLITIISYSFDDQSRIIEGIIVGVGFLGAGTIIASRERVRGLTTAASLWMTCMIGIAVGAGKYILAIIVAVVAFIILRLGKVKG